MPSGDDGLMGLDLNRWFNYARARVNAAVGQGHQSLDRLEAKREADLADKPWLRSDSEAPTLDEARARIEWEADRQRRDQASTSTADQNQDATSSASTPRATPAAPARSPQAIATDADQEAARLQLDRRQQASAERLEAIRAELGVDDPPAGSDAKA